MMTPDTLYLKIFFSLKKRFPKNWRSKKIFPARWRSKQLHLSSNRGVERTSTSLRISPIVFFDKNQKWIMTRWKRFKKNRWKRTYGILKDNSKNLPGVLRLKNFTASWYLPKMQVCWGMSRVVIRSHTFWWLVSVHLKSPLPKYHVQKPKTHHEGKGRKNILIWSMCVLRIITFNREIWSNFIENIVKLIQIWSPNIYYHIN